MRAFQRVQSVRTGRTPYLALLPEAPVALLERAHRAQKVDAAERGPEDVGEVELAVHALPQHEAGQADLAAGADDQVGFGQVRRVEITADRFGRDVFDQ